MIAHCGPERFIARHGAFVILSLLLILLGAPALAFELPPFKDELFTNPRTIEERDGGDYRIVDYRKERDIHGRDAIAERRVRREYVDLRIRQLQRDLTLRFESAAIRHIAVGPADNARVIVIYLHGRGGNRHQGMNDFTFGGNFNRIKNLIGRNGGLYLTPDVHDFGSKGVAEVAALIAAYAQRSPRAPVIVACGSMGGALCWGLARLGELHARIGGLILLGSHWDESFLNTPTYYARTPIFFAHGSRDAVFPVQNQEAFYQKIRRLSPGYPARFVRFETGSHGTPIRMVDWRQTINWMLSQQSN